MNDEGTVIPPGGPRVRSLVHHVGPLERVSQTEKGLEIQPYESDGASQSTKLSDPDAIITPGGRRHRSLVHHIQPGTVLDGTGGRHRMLDRRSGEVRADFGMIHPRTTGRPLMPDNVVHPDVSPPALGSGWITDAYWNRTSAPISSFLTSWVVPPAPSTQSGQLIYLFNGIQNSTMIFQPVLQWGNNGSFGGNYWCVATWYADGQGGAAFHSTPTTVNAGDVLTGVITLTNQSVAGFSYNGSFQGIANSGYSVTNVAEMWQAVETLECYGITQCSDYPVTSKTAMSAISIQTGTTPADVVWTIENRVTDCGQHTLVFDMDTAGHGEVDLWYRDAPYWTVGAGTVAPGANWTSWFAWGGNGDVGPQFIQGEPLNTSGYLWTTQIGESRDSNGNLAYYATVNNQSPNAVAFQWRGGGR